MATTFCYLRYKLLFNSSMSAKTLPVVVIAPHQIVYQINPNKNFWGLHAIGHSVSTHWKSLISLQVLLELETVVAKVDGGTTEETSTLKGAVE